MVHLVSYYYNDNYNNHVSVRRDNLVYKMSIKCGKMVKYEYEWWSVHPKKFNNAMFSSAKSLLNAKNVGIFAFEMAEKKLIGYLNLNYNLWHCSILLWQKPDTSVVRLY